MNRIRLNDRPVTTARNGKSPSNGRFLPGNKCASGRNSRTAWREAFDAACSPADMRAIVRRAVEQAKRGEPRAREWLGSYALQRPPRVVDLHVEQPEYGEDGLEWEYLSKGPNPAWKKYD